MKKIFLSYSHKDTEIADYLRNELIKRGIADVWDDSKLKSSGVNWAEKVLEAIDQSSAVIMLISPDFFSSNMMFLELGYASEGGKNIIPVIISDVNVNLLPNALKSRKMLKTKSLKDKTIDKLEEALA